MPTPQHENALISPLSCTTEKLSIMAADAALEQRQRVSTYGEMPTHEPAHALPRK